MTNNTAENGTVRESHPMVESALAPSLVDPLTVILQLMQTMHEDRKKDKERENLFPYTAAVAAGQNQSRARIEVSIHHKQR